MKPQEGVIRFSLQHTPSAPLTDPVISALSAWHTRLYELGLVGQDPARYGGYAYGNMSARLDEETFIISGTQTGGMARLDANHYCVIDSCDIHENRVQSHGPVEPSSECLTHAALYASGPSIAAVTHVHSPGIWNNAGALGLYLTDPTVTYGTPAMARAVAVAIREMSADETGLLCMGGHEDGVIAWGRTVEQASRLVIETLAMLP